MTSGPGQTPLSVPPGGELRSAGAALVNSGELLLLLASLSLGWLAWRVFFHFAPALWAQQFPVDLSTVTPWALPAFDDGDGAEPFALLALVLSATALVCGVAYLLRWADLRVRAAILLISVVGSLLFARQFSFTVPLPAVAPSFAKSCLVLVAAVAASGLLGWGQRHGRTLSALTALLLLPVALVPSDPMSVNDASAMLAPGLRLLHGVAPHHVYMQYDYALSLIVEAWLWLGGDPAGFFFITALSFYALLVGLFVLVRRWFSEPGLAGPLIVAVAIVRIYAVRGGAAAVPQVGPLRLDLWILPVALALRFGLRHWAVAALLGLMCIFFRSIGVLYLGGYGLAIGAEFLALRAAVSKSSRAPLLPELWALLRKLAPGGFIIVACIGIATAILGSPISDAVLTYRKLGCGQLKIASGSFYWWLLPLTALTGGLAFSKRVELGEKRGGATLLMVALVMSGSIYFFGRSHPHNLINLSAAFLTCFFLCFDLSLLRFRQSVLPILPVQVLVSTALVALVAWQYSDRVWTKAATQVSVVSHTDVTQPLVPGLGLPLMYCSEVATAAPDRKVYFFSGLDTWFYADCGYPPPSYMQPMNLAILKPPLLDELNQLLDDGYLVALPKNDFFTGPFESDFRAPLTARTNSTKSEHYEFFRRTPESPRHRRRRGTPRHPPSSSQ
ncbi:MAG: hypothetical protein ABJB12_22010 [Pseudomonadota bacterium]